MSTTIKQAAPVTLEEFYAETLKANGVTAPNPADIEKLAAARGVSAELAKIAQSVYNQMLVDGVEHESPQSKLADAFTVAENYLKHNRTCAEFGAALAEELKIAAAAAVQAVLTKHQVELSTHDALKMAELAQGVVSVSPEQMQAAQAVIITAASTADGEEMSKRAAAAVNLPEFDARGLFHGGTYDANALDLHAFYAATGAYYGGDADLGRKVASALSGSEKTADHRGPAHAFVAIAAQTRTWPESMKFAAAQASLMSPAVEWYLNARRSDEIQLRASSQEA